MLISQQDITLQVEKIFACFVWSKWIRQDENTSLNHLWREQTAILKFVRLFKIRISVKIETIERYS